MKKFLIVVLIFVFIIGVYVGLMPTDYSFYCDETPACDNPMLSFSLDEAKAAQTFTASGTLSEGRYNAKIKLFGVLPIKSARINIIKKQQLIPLGFPFGVKLYTDGVIIVDITDFVNGGKIQNPAFDAGVREGDVIISYNGVKIKSNEELIEQVKKCGGNPQKVVVKRNNVTFETDITPLKDDTDGNYRIGLWVRDSTAGIGTLTFYNASTNTLCGLGHSISDTDTGLIMPVSSGELVKARIEGVVKGTKGNPGELLGSFLDDSAIGVLSDNSTSGLSAVCVTDEYSDLQEFPIAIKSEISVGKANVICCVDGTERETYEIEIIKINNNLEERKNMVIKITDERLLSKTGGIVQGMSGSPIIQNGKLIGAVTHVLVNDPTKGYGIFIENMLDAANSVAEDN